MSWIIWDYYQHRLGLVCLLKSVNMNHRNRYAINISFPPFHRWHFILKWVYNDSLLNIQLIQCDWWWLKLSMHFFPYPLPYFFGDMIINWYSAKCISFKFTTPKLFYGNLRCNRIRSTWNTVVEAQSECEYIIELTDVWSVSGHL